jgi:hypothetical protein
MLHFLLICPLELGKADGKLRKQLALILAGFVISFYESGFLMQAYKYPPFVLNILCKYTGGGEYARKK